MNKYVIKVERLDFAPGNVQTYCKWANDHKQALDYIFKNRNKSGLAMYRRGGVGRIISVQRLSDASTYTK
jgi:hypothetical protein